MVRPARCRPRKACSVSALALVDPVLIPKRRNLLFILFHLSQTASGFVKGGLKNLVGLLLAPLFLIACSNTSLSELNPTSTNSPPPSTIVATQTFTPEPSETPTLTLTPTPSPSFTPTPTFTETPTDTPTPTITPTPTAVYNAPGLYVIGKCVELKVHVLFCVLNVNVLANGSMVFNVSWKSLISNVSITKKSDLNNPNMYLTDNLGNRYNHVEVGGDAALRIKMEPKQVIYGYFAFPPALPGATSFQFHDSDQGEVISEIVLLVTP